MFGRVTYEGKNYRVYKGKNATVCLRELRGRKYWEVSEKRKGVKHAHRTLYSLDDLGAANDHARRLDGPALQNGGDLSDDDITALRLFREWETNERAEGRAVPRLFEIVLESAKQSAEDRQKSTLSSIAAAYLEEAKKRLTQPRYKLAQRVITGTVAALPEQMGVDDIEEEQLRETVRSIARASSGEETIRQYLAILSTMWQWAIDRQRAARNTAKLARNSIARPVIHHITYLNVDDCQKLLHAAAQHNPKRHAIIFVLGLLTGIRLAERCRLTWDDLRLEDDHPHIYLPAGKTKTTQSRIVYLHGTHADILRALLPPPSARRKNQSIVGDYSSERIAQECAMSAAAAIAAAAGVTLPRNVLRHTAATYLTAYLGSAGQAAMNLGHTEAILKKHYRGLVTTAQAAPFFELRVS